MSNKKIVVANLIGIPASGKTTIAQLILNLARDSLLNVNVIAINFDEMLEINFENLADGVYKQIREEFFEKIEKFIEKFKQTDTALQDLKISSNFIHMKHDNAITLIILDDNMYYRSMRQRVRQICKNCDCNYFQIFMKCTLNDALMRNSVRSSNVTDSVIERMLNDLEIPINSRTIIIEIEKIDRNALLNDLNDRIENPERLTECPEIKQQQQQSIIHEIDLITRKEVRIRMEELRGSTASDNLKAISQKLNDKRKEFMDNVRNEAIKCDNIEELKIAFANFI